LGGGIIRVAMAFLGNFCNGFSGILGDGKGWIRGWNPDARTTIWDIVISNFKLF
jgi:hypothetical protein